MRNRDWRTILQDDFFLCVLSYWMRGGPLSPRAKCKPSMHPSRLRSNSFIESLGYVIPFSYGRCLLPALESDCAANVWLAKGPAQRCLHLHVLCPSLAISHVVRPRAVRMSSPGILQMHALLRAFIGIFMLDYVEALYRQETAIQHPGDDHPRQSRPPIQGSRDVGA